jgi:peptidoglycan/xylan/chitin deacetylase (PgdA/CDA1 family)
MADIRWNIDTEDWKSKNADTVYNEIMRGAHDGNIILLHSIYESTAAAVERALPVLAKQGFKFVTITDLFSQNGISPAVSYFSRGESRDYDV